MRADPDVFADNLCFGNDPRLARYGMQTRVPMMHWPKQRLLYHAVLEGRRLAVDASRDTGKTFVPCEAICYQLITKPGTSWGIGSKTGADVYDGTIDSVGGKIEWLLRNMPRSITGEWKVTSSPYFKLVMENGNFVVGRKTTPGAWHGPRKTGIMLDEVARIPRLGAVMRGVDGATDCPVLVTTPNGPIGYWADLIHGRGPAIVEAGPERDPTGAYEHIRMLFSDDPRKGPEWEEAKKLLMTLAAWMEQYKCSYKLFGEGIIWPEFKEDYHVLDDGTWREVVEGLRYGGYEIYEIWDPGVAGTAVCWIAYSRANDEAYILDWRFWSQVRAHDIMDDLAEARSELAPNGWATARNPGGREPDHRVADPAMNARRPSDLKSWKDDLADHGIHLKSRHISGRSATLRNQVAMAFLKDKLFLSPRCKARYTGLTLPECLSTWSINPTTLKPNKGPASHPCDTVCYGVDWIWPSGNDSAIVVPGHGGSIETL
jgi:hypothetical protein